MGASQCAIICGLVFSIIPVLFLRFMCSGILFRKIVHKHGLTQATMILMAGLLMYFNGPTVNELVNVCIWSVSAFVSFKLVALIIEEANRMVQHMNPRGI